MKKAVLPILILYVITLVLLACFSFLFIDPNLSYLHKLYTGFASNNRAIITGIYCMFIILLFVFYCVFLLLIFKKNLAISQLKFMIAITIGMLLFSYPAMLSHDIFNYITTAKVIFHYHENPYIIMPIEFIGEPYLLFTHAANKIALYGPVWILLTSVPHFIGHGDFILTVFCFKLLSSVFYIATILLIWKMSKNLLVVTFFALNPLVVIETLVSGHNDIVMMFLSLFAYFLVLKKKIFLGIIFFILSILIKYATIFLLPVFIYMVWRILRKKPIDNNKILFISMVLMSIIFFLSPLREEIYSWYAIWFLIFGVFLIKNKFLFYSLIIFSASLLVRYVPYMFLGTYSDPTPLIKTLITFLPLIIFIFFFSILTYKKKYG